MPDTVLECRTENFRFCDGRHKPCVKFPVCIDKLTKTSQMLITKEQSGGLETMQREKNMKKGAANLFLSFSVCILVVCGALFLLSGCGGGGSDSATTTTTSSSTGTVSGTITLPSNTNAKWFQPKRSYWARLFGSDAHAATITDVTTLTVTSGSNTIKPDATGKYTLTVNAGTNVDVTVTAPTTGNVVLEAIVPSVTAGATASQDITTTTTAVALIYKANTSLSVSSISTTSSSVTNVKSLIETYLTDATDDSITGNSTVTTAAANAASVLSSSTTLQYYDVHTHLNGKMSATASDFEGAADVAVSYMNKYGVKTLLAMAPPISTESEGTTTQYECSEMSGVLSRYPDRFAFLCGGGTLNVMIQKAVKGQTVSTTDFQTQARTLMSTTGFVGFGELAALHLCLSSTHFYMAAPPDHALFKALVDVAAEKTPPPPIEIHMEAVSSNMDTPSSVLSACTSNPATLSENITAFKNLLDYAKTRNVNIIWDHQGMDTTGMRTSTLVADILSKYSNLYISVKDPNSDPLNVNSTKYIDGNGAIKSDWQTVFDTYSSRFIMGADHFFYSPKLASTAVVATSFEETWGTAFPKFSSDLKTKFGTTNTKTLFNLQ